jgi:transcriptional regulator GlxA family with amidase domain
MEAGMTKTGTVAILAPPGVQLLDVSGPLDVFAETNVQARREVYRLLLVATKGGEIRSSSGTRLMPDQIIGAPLRHSIDTLLVAGCPNAAEISAAPAVINWLRQVAPATRRYGSVCSGAFFLAAAGLLDGKRVTTHWAVADRLAQAYPSITVEADAIHVRDGRLRTAAGVTAGLDLALTLVEEDVGRDIAMKVAAQLVMFFKRPGGQMQFSRKGESLPAGRSAPAGGAALHRCEPVIRSQRHPPCRPFRPQSTPFRAPIPKRGRRHPRRLGGSRARSCSAAHAGERTRLAQADRRGLRLRQC